MKRLPHGVSIVETIAAVAVLATVCTISLQYMSATAVQRREIERRHAALQEAENILERLTALPWDKLSSTSAEKIELSPDLRNALPGAQLNVEVVPGESDVSEKKISLTLSWNDHGGNSVSPVRLTTWRFRAAKAASKPEMPADSKPKIEPIEKDSPAEKRSAQRNSEALNA